MVSATSEWSTRIISIIALATSAYTLWRIFKGQIALSITFPAHNCLIVFFVVGIILSLLVLSALSAQLPLLLAPYETLLSLVVPGCKIVHWTLVPVLLSINHYYLKINEIWIANYFHTESDAIAVAFLWICLLMGVSNHYEHAVAFCLLPIGVMGISIWSMNIFSVIAMALVVISAVIRLFYPESSQRDPLTDKDFLLHDTRMVLLTVIFMSTAVWKVVSKSPGLLFDSALWQSFFGEYGAK